MTKGFTAVIKIRGPNPFILVSASRANAIKSGWRKPIPVLVRVNGKPPNAWRISINMMPVGNGLSRIADHPINRIEELLPWNVAAEAAAHSLHAA